MNTIKTAACRLLCDLQRDISLPELIHYTETRLEWQVVYYNTEKGDALLETFDQKLSKFDKKERGFCYKTIYGKYIFIDNDQNTEQKLCTLIHEIGHILLGHLVDGKLQNPTQNNVDADVFVKYVLYPSRLDMIRFKLSRKAGWIMLPGITLVLALALFVSHSMTMDAPVSGYLPANTDTVYITPSGNKYHDENCRFAANGAIAIPIQQAAKHYAPCSYCNPNQ